MNRITDFLNKIFSSRITKTYYYNDKKVDKLPKEVQESMKEAFKSMDEAFKHMEKVFEEKE